LRTALRSILVALLALGLVAVFLRNADLARVWAAMLAARLDLLLLAVACVIVSYFVRTERWQYLLAPLGPTRFGVAFRATVIGFAASAVLPARAGELLRPYILARQEGLSATATFATIILERVLDLVAVLALLAVYVVWLDADLTGRDTMLFQAVRLGGLVTAPASLAVLVVMFVMAGQPDRLHALVLGIEHFVPGKAAGMLARATKMLAEGFAVVRRPERLLAAMGWSLVMWLVIAAETWFVTRAFGIDMPFVGAWLVQALLVVGIAVPTPGGVGGFHEAFRLGATVFFGADNDAAIGAAIVLHAASLVPVTLMGVWFAASDGGLRRLAAGTRTERAR
jgi:uncharacterized protein (TIRG00374 family)